MTLTQLLGPLASRRLRRMQMELDVVPVPTDAPRSTTAGLQSDRVLLLGNGAVIGFGVRTQELALPGQLARRLAASTGRGAVVQVAAERGLRISSGPRLVREQRLSTCDAVVLSMGATDAAALTRVEAWIDGLERTLDQLRAATAPGSIVLVLPASPLQRTRGTAGHRRHLSDRHAERLDDATRAVCARREDVLLLEPDSSAAPPRTADDYAALAERMSAVLAPRLDVLARDASSTTARARRRGPDPELLRQQALDRTGLLGRGSSAELDRLLQHARTLFEASAAAVTLIDGDDVVYTAAAGIDAPSTSRAVAPCNRAIRQDGPYVVRDLAGELVAEQGWRFYAGHPLESPDGYRIGTLCVLDASPRDRDIDRIALVELAVRVQTELWRRIREGRLVEPSAPAAGLLRVPVVAGR